MKFDRRFKLLYELEDSEGLGNNKAIEISSPLTIEFDITRNTSSTLNSASFRLYNLNPTNRDIIYRNRTSIQTIRNRQRVVLKAGYRSFGNPIDEDSGLSTIFIGDLLEAYSWPKNSDQSMLNGNVI